MPKPAREWTEVWLDLVQEVEGSDQPLQVIAKKANVARGTVSKVLRGINGVSDDTVNRVLRAAGATPWQITKAGILRGGGAS